MDDLALAVVWAVWAAAMTPLGFMLGSSCSPCCGETCGVNDGKPRTDPTGEGTWVPNGDWPNVSWSFVPNDGSTEGEVWYFYGSVSTSVPPATLAGGLPFEYTNLCNWYSSKTTAPDSTANIATVLDKRATRLPPPGAVVHVYSRMDLPPVPVTLKSIYVWGGQASINNTLGSPPEAGLTLTQAAHGTTKGLVAYGGADVGANINGGVFAYGFPGLNAQVGSGGLIINGGVILNGRGSVSGGTVNDGVVLNGDTNINTFAVVNGGGVLNDIAANFGTINGGAVCSDGSSNLGTINGGAVLNDTAVNANTVNGGAVFNGSSKNGPFGTVNGGAMFNDAACSERFVGLFFLSPCTKRFVAHPTDLPTCNGTAPAACDDPAATCGCG